MEEDIKVDKNFPLFYRKKSAGAKKISQTPKTSSLVTAATVETPKSFKKELNPDPTPAHVAFSDLGLAEWAVKTCKELGMKRPTPVQQHCVPRILSGQDVMGLAQTGSGKTAAFALPILHRLAEDPYGVFALVVTPTRELAYQLAEQFRAFVLDEADRVLGANFEAELRVIFQCLPKNRQTLLFSATMTSNLQTLLELSANKAYYYAAYEGFKTVESLRQQYVFIPKNLKDVYLLHVLNKMEGMNVRSAMIFVSTCRSCELLSLLLEQLELEVAALHSFKSQSSRLSALHKFKSGQVSLLIATDVANRGLDIPTVDLVLNYDIPRCPEDYVHRVGRTARAGRGGLALSFVSQNDVDLVLEIEAVIGRQLEKFECKEKEVIEDNISKVYKARRVVTMRMMDDGFDEKAMERKAQKLK